MVVVVSLFTLGGLVVAVLGALLLRNANGWGTAWVERNILKLLRMGDADSHRLILGSGYLVVGTLFATVGLVWIANHA